MPTSNTAAKIVDKTIVEILNDAIPIAEAAIIASQPWMGTPVLKEVWEEILTLLVHELSNALGTASAYVAMDVQKYLALSNAAQALIELQAAQKAGYPNGIQDASRALDEAVAPILHYVGDAHP